MLFVFFIMEDVQSIDQIGMVKACLGISLFMVLSVSLINLLVWIKERIWMWWKKKKRKKS